MTAFDQACLKLLVKGSSLCLSCTFLMSVELCTLRDVQAALPKPQMFMVWIIQNWGWKKLSECCTQTVADLERKKRVMGGGCSHESAREGWVTVEECRGHGVGGEHILDTSLQGRFPLDCRVQRVKFLAPNTLEKNIFDRNLNDFRNSLYTRLQCTTLHLLYPFYWFK